MTSSVHPAPLLRAGEQTRRASRQVAPAPRVLVIYKKSAYQIYVRERRHAHIEQLLAARDTGALRLLRAHKDHLHSLDSAREALQRLGADAKFRHRSDDTHAQNVDLVVTLGGDGTLLWASHLVSANTPIIAINTAPKDSVGYFCAGTKHEIDDVLADALSGKLPSIDLTRMQVELNGTVLSKRVLNDALYCHESPAATARYGLRLGRHYEEQKSSGVWVGPAAGSSAAQRSAGGKLLPIDATDLQYVVREPYEVNGIKYALKKGLLGSKQSLKIESHMRAGRLFLDGPHTEHVVEMASKIEFRQSPEPLTVLGFRRRRAPRAPGA
ncbi:MAG: NAD(+)/NADH kinase [Polyangiales bacterium]